MANQKCYFVSDIHLSSNQDPKYRILCDWLGSLKPDETEAILLLGDIFDLWLGGHEIFQKEYQELINILKTLRSRSVKIIYLEGNHDLHLKSFWQNELGFEVSSGPLSLSLQGLKARLEHGDQMDPEDQGYLWLRWFLRTSLIKTLAEKLPGRWIAAIGKLASRHSRHYTTEVKTQHQEQSRTKHRTHAKGLSQSKDFDVFIAGHLHVWDTYNWEHRGRRFESFNLGTWLEKPKVLVLAGGQFSWLDLP